jgi:hypothetical protein
MMGLQNDLRDREEILRVLSYFSTVLPMYRRRVAEAQERLDELMRDQDHARERLFVLDHEYREGQ